MQQKKDRKQQNFKRDIEDIKRIIEELEKEMYLLGYRESEVLTNATERY